MLPTITLVGAGPGDPELLTLKAARLLAAADVVAYDDLVAHELLGFAAPSARLLAVGYRGFTGQGHAPDVLHPEVRDAALAGQKVVRLKCGDPLLFARAHEEIQAMASYGIACEVVPGISAAFGAAASLGLPLTQRGVASSVLLMSGHAAYPSAIEREVTRVMYMPRRHLQSLCAAWQAQGLAAATPAAFVVDATTSRQQLIVSRLDELASIVDSQALGGAGLVILGAAVAALRPQTTAAAGPLSGERLLLARSSLGRGRVGAHLRALGAVVIEAPLILAKAKLDAPLWHNQAALLRSAEAWFFTSKDSVTGFCQGLSAHRIDLRGLPSVAIGAADIETCVALRACGLPAVIGLPQGAEARGKPIVAGPRLLCLADGMLSPELARQLKAHDPALLVQHTISPYARYLRLGEPRPSLLVLPHARATRCLLAGDLGIDLRGVLAVSMGARTTDAAKAAGVQRILTASQPTLESLSELVLQALGKASQPRFKQGVMEHHQQAECSL